MSARPLFVLVLGLVLAAGAAACSSSKPVGLPPALAKATPVQFLNTTLANVQHMGSFHYLDASTEAGQSTVTIAGDAGTLAGQQTVTGGASTLEVRDYNRTAYIRAATPVLQQILQISQAVAASHAGQWISVPQSDSRYQAIADSVTYNGELASFIPAGKLSFGRKTTLQGQEVVGVSGAARSADGQSGKTTLYITVKSPYLPAGATLNLGSGSSQRDEAVAFSAWGEAVTPQAPAGAVPVASL